MRADAAILNGQRPTHILIPGSRRPVFQEATAVATEGATSTVSIPRPIQSLTTLSETERHAEAVFMRPRSPFAAPHLYRSDTPRHSPTPVWMAGLRHKLRHKLHRHFGRAFGEATSQWLWCTDEISGSFPEPTP